MKVTVTDKCDRCKREAPKEIEHTEVDKLQTDETQRVANFTTIKQSADQLKGVLPDLIVIFKGNIQTINHVCDANCKQTIEHQLEAMFREIDPTKRAPRKTRTPGETPTETPQTGETSHEHEKKGKNVVEGGAHPKAGANKK